ncbi:MAG: DNA methyltransferase [Desulfococcaceae bacterium]
MANLFTDSFFRKQMGKIKAELGIDDAQLEKYRETVMKRIAYVNDFNPETDSEEKDWPGFERDVFHDLLGYKIKDDDPQDYHIFRQSKVKGAGKHGGTGKTDCTLGFYSKNRQRDGNDPVIVEFKAPDTPNLDEAADQLWNYMTRHEKCRWGIVSNFNEITLYHRNRERDRKQTFYFSVSEDEKDKKFPLIRYLGADEDEKSIEFAGTDKDGKKYDYTELIKFLAIFRKDRLICEHGESVTDKMLAVQGIEEKKIEKEFYEKYYRLRIDLFNEIAEYNSQYRKNREELVSVTQKILDRLIFIWFCEDSREELLPRNILQRLIGGLMKKSPDMRSENDVWEEIKRLFKAVDDGKGFHIGNGYNGELFKPDSRIDDLVIPGRIFEQQVKPIGEEYDFGHEKELSVNILGHIFEQSISDLEELKQEEPADRKTGKRKREGVYYTPEYITRYIVKQALGGWLAERRKELGEENLPKLTDQVKSKSPKKGGKPAVQKPKITEKMKKDLHAATGNEELVKKLGYLKTRFKDEAQLREILATVPEAEQYTDMIVEMAMPKDADLENWYIFEKYWRSYREVLKNVKVLDPACGSGAFLIQAFDFLHEEGEKVNQAMENLGLGNENIFDLDRQILENNLHGVDINDESVEITKLSLWLKTAVKHKKLNNLFNNIKCGNSLIDDPKVAGKKAFKWEKEFPEIMKNGGFDVVVGNPPYINSLELSKVFANQVKKYWKNIFVSAKGTYDIYLLFFELGLKKLRKNGMLGYITPNKYISAPYGKSFRKYLADNYRLIELSDFSSIKVFEEPSVYPVVTVIKNEMIRDYFFKSKKIGASDSLNCSENLLYADILTLLPDNMFSAVFSRHINLLSTIINNSEKLENIANVNATSTAAEADYFSEFIKENKKGNKVVNTGTIDPYSALWGYSPMKDKGKQYLRPTLDIESVEISEYRKTMYKSPKLIFAKIALKPEVYWDKSGEFASINTNCVYNPGDSFPLGFLACILNSKLMFFAYKEFFGGLCMSGGYLQFQAPQLRILPIKTSKNQKNFIEKADTMLDLNRQLSEQKQSMIEYLTVNHNIDNFPQKLRHPENLDFADFIKELKKKKIGTDDKTVYESLKDFHTKIRELKSQIDQTDREVDQMVYDLYGLTEDERKIVEQACG